ncbi:MAG: hypothetical protein ACW9W3_02455 [Candidatus Nitrosopumilus sp. bin_68KS]
MPKWSKAKEIQLTENERVAILRKTRSNHKNWNEVSSFNIDQATINGLRDFEEQERIKFSYDEEENRVSIHYLPDYPNKLALK